MAAFRNKNVHCASRRKNILLSWCYIVTINKSYTLFQFSYSTVGNYQKSIADGGVESTHDLEMGYNIYGDREKIFHEPSYT